MTAAAAQSLYSKGPRTARVLLSSVAIAAALIALMLVSTRLRTGCAGVLTNPVRLSSHSRKAGMRLGGFQENSSEVAAAVQVQDSKYKTIPEHSVCSFYRVAWNQSSETRW
jgi:hypothetical protein